MPTSQQAQAYGFHDRKRLKPPRQADDKAEDEKPYIPDLYYIPDIDENENPIIEEIDLDELLEEGGIPTDDAEFDEWEQERERERERAAEFADETGSETESYNSPPASKKAKRSPATSDTRSASPAQPRASTSAAKPSSSTARASASRSASRSGSPDQPRASTSAAKPSSSSARKPKNPSGEGESKGKGKDTGGKKTASAKGKGKVVAKGKGKKKAGYLSDEEEEEEELNEDEDEDELNDGAESSSEEEPEPRFTGESAKQSANRDKIEISVLITMQPPPRPTKSKRGRGSTALTVTTSSPLGGFSLTRADEHVDLISHLFALPLLKSLLSGPSDPRLLSISYAWPKGGKQPFLLDFDSSLRLAQKEFHLHHTPKLHGGIAWIEPGPCPAGSPVQPQSNENADADESEAGPAPKNLTEKQQVLKRSLIERLKTLRITGICCPSKRCITDEFGMHFHVTDRVLTVWSGTSRDDDDPKTMQPPWDHRGLCHFLKPKHRLQSSPDFNTGDVQQDATFPQGTHWSALTPSLRLRSSSNSLSKRSSRLRLRHLPSPSTT
ncbi:hypothetical protein JCM1840_002975 [Sporobolomyces johnsonii]